MSQSLDAAATDPKSLGLMQGFPPAPDKRLTLTEGSSRRFPNSRWTLSQMRQTGPTVNVRRGPGAATPLPRAERDDLDAVSFTAMDGRTLNWGESLGLNFTDGIVILHKGQIIQERYFGALKPELTHLAFSVTKSFVGLLAAILAHEGRLDPEQTVTAYVPELAATAYGDATVRQVMDMTIGVKYSEVYVDPEAEVWAYSRAAGLSPMRADYDGPRTIFDFLLGLKKEGEHGQAFAYKTCNTEVLSWIIQRLTGQSIAELISERIWQRLGAEEDGDLHVDSIGIAMAGGGLNTTLRDLARFGEMMRLGGHYNGQQIVPEAVVKDIENGADQAHFAKAGVKTLPGWSYRNMWWVAHDRFGAYSARGIHGQALWIAPKADLVIARYASHPVAGNGNSVLDEVSLPAYHAIADHLMKG
jgi:CubicO group peptidase (beta-lactamase class C family)